MTREEAINKVRQMSLPKETMDILEALAPELKESEDERIIEEIKFAVMQMPSSRQDTKNRCLAWLEKQKEQKPVECKEYTSPDCGTSACCDDECFEIIAQAKSDIIEKTNIAENALSMELPLLDGILMRVWQVGWLNKKPAEWSEEDEQRIAEIEFAVMQMNTKRVDTKDKCLTWLKSLRPSQSKSGVRKMKES